MHLKPEFGLVLACSNMYVQQQNILDKVKQNKRLLLDFFLSSNITFFNCFLLLLLLLLQWDIAMMLAIHIQAYKKQQLTVYVIKPA